MVLRRCREARVRAALITTCVVLAGVLSSCTTWKHHARGENWSLYVKPGSGVDTQAFEELLDPALAAVEAELGDFQRPVRVHAWDGGVNLESGTRGQIVEGEDAGLVQSNLGVARVRAFHVKRDPFGPGGVFLGEPSPGAAVHELVHARLAELRPAPPLWFEEGLAMFLGDGELAEDGWKRDGLCAWPRSVLRKTRPDDQTLAEILALKSGTEHTVDQNLLVHFIGWALVFDLYRSDPDGDWRTWLATFEADFAANPDSARQRIDRSLDNGTLLVWLNDKLSDPDPGVRCAAARGMWRGADSASLQLLSSALRHETDPSVKATLAINILAAAGEGRFPGRGRWNGLRLPVEVLRRLEFGSVDDMRAAERLVAGYRGRASGRTIEQAFKDLESYWQE